MEETPGKRRGLSRLAVWISAAAAVPLLMVVVTAGLLISHPRSTGQHTIPIPSASRPISSTLLPIPPAPASIYLIPDSNQTTNGDIIALNASDGSVRWRVKIGVAGPAPVLKDSVLYVGSTLNYGTDAAQGFISAFRASDGRLIWQHQLLADVDRLIVSDGAVYVSSEQGTQAYTRAYRASDGALLWRFDQGTLSAVANGLVYIGAAPTDILSMDSPLYAVNARDGSIKWQRPGNGPQHSTLWAVYPAGDILYVIAGSIGYGGPLPVTLVALNPGTGKQLWSRDALGGFIEPEAQVAVVMGHYGGSAATPLLPGQVYGLNNANGKVRWQFQLSAPVHLTGVASENGALYLGERRALSRRNRSYPHRPGRQLWRDALAGDAGRRW